MKERKRLSERGIPGLAVIGAALHTLAVPSSVVGASFARS